MELLGRWKNGKATSLVAEIFIGCMFRICSTWAKRQHLCGPTSIRLLLIMNEEFVLS
jgi:hypothetical protein